MLNFTFYIILASYLSVSASTDLETAHLGKQRPKETRPLTAASVLSREGKSTEQRIQAYKKHSCPWRTHSLHGPWASPGYRQEPHMKTPRVNKGMWSITLSRRPQKMVQTTGQNAVLKDQPYIRGMEHYL